MFFPFATRLTPLLITVPVKGRTIALINRAGKRMVEETVWRAYYNGRGCGGYVARHEQGRT